MTRTWCLAVLILGTLVAATDAQGQTKKISYAITDLGALGVSSENASAAKKINNFGQVVGGSFGDATPRHAVIWEQVDGEWTIRDLGSPPDVEWSVAWANGINELGDAAGYGNTGTTTSAFFYDGLTGEMELVLPEGYQSSSASSGSINNWQQVVGRLRPIGGGYDRAGLWERNEDCWTFVELPAEPSASSSAHDINDNGLIVGQASFSACLWELKDGVWTITDLGGRWAYNVNNNENPQIVGYSSTDGTARWCVWERVDGEWIKTDLPKPSDFKDIWGWDLNDVGQVVGYGRLTSGNHAAVLYDGGVMHRLDNFLPTGSGWRLTIASGINDHGHIVGSGISPAGIERAFLMDTRALTYSYTSTGSAVSIKDKSTASKSMTLSDNETITDLNVAVNLYHTRYQDLKIELVGPNNVTRLLCNAGALSGSGTKTIVFDDDGGAGTIQPAQPLSYYDGASTQGKWTLRVSDTVRNFKTGTFTSFTLDVVPAL